MPNKGKMASAASASASVRPMVGLPSPNKDAAAAPTRTSQEQARPALTFLIVRRGDKLHQVLNLQRPTPDGDYLQRINSIDFRDDGTVYFLAGTIDDDLVLYEAKPIF